MVLGVRRVSSAIQDPIIRPHTRAKPVQQASANVRPSIALARVLKRVLASGTLNMGPAGAPATTGGRRGRGGVPGVALMSGMSGCKSTSRSFLRSTTTHVACYFPPRHRSFLHLTRNLRRALRRGPG